MQYKEDMLASKKHKQEYTDGISKLIEQRQKDAMLKRDEYIKNIMREPKRYREDFRAMLGWPLVDYECSSLPDVTAERLADEQTHTIYRMQFEILNGLKMTGLFFKAKGEGEKPLIIVQHGGLGTPEMVAGFYGDTANYNDMLERVTHRGVHAFAPQLLLWDDCYDVPFDRKEIDARLKRVGSSITAIEVFGITRILDYFEGQEFVSCFGMVGMSYGGFYTLFTAAADERIKTAVSSSFFNTRDRIGWCDWVWQSSAEKFDDAEVACLIYPRKLWIAMGDSDELFDYKYTQKSFERLKSLSKEVGSDWVKLAIFEGKHEFIKDDTFIDELMREIL